MIYSRNLGFLYKSPIFKAALFTCISTILFETFSTANNERQKSLNFHVHQKSNIQGAAPLTSKKVTDTFACMFFCLQKSECLTVTMSRTTDDNGESQCTAYSVPLGIMGTKLVASDFVDLYDSTFEEFYTCTHAKFQGFHESRTYIIDPDGANGPAHPFSVFCNMTSHDGVGVTVVTHDSEARTAVNGCEPSGCYSRRVKYHGISGVEQLRALAKTSFKCEQFIKYECRDSILFSPHDVNGTPAAWLESREGENMTYWGGAPRNSRQCKNGSCNCDINDDIWREDSGLLSYKEDLPVMGLRFGDVGGDSEMGYHTLGPLKCYG